MMIEVQMLIFIPDAPLEQNPCKRFAPFVRQGGTPSGRRIVNKSNMVGDDTKQGTSCI